MRALHLLSGGRKLRCIPRETARGQKICREYRDLLIDAHRHDVGHVAAGRDGALRDVRDTVVPRAGARPVRLVAPECKAVEVDGEAMHHHGEVLREVVVDIDLQRGNPTRHDFRRQRKS